MDQISEWAKAHQATMFWLAVVAGLLIFRWLV